MAAARLARARFGAARRGLERAVRAGPSAPRPPLTASAAAGRGRELGVEHVHLGVVVGPADLARDELRARLLSAAPPRRTLSTPGRHDDDGRGARDAEAHAQRARRPRRRRRGAVVVGRGGQRGPPPPPPPSPPPPRARARELAELGAAARGRRTPSSTSKPTSSMISPTRRTCSSRSSWVSGASRRAAADLRARAAGRRGESSSGAGCASSSSPGCSLSACRPARSGARRAPWRRRAAKERPGRPVRRGAVERARLVVEQRLELGRRLLQVVAQRGARRSRLRRLRRRRRVRPPPPRPSFSSAASRLSARSAPPRRRRRRRRRRAASARVGPAAVVVAARRARGSERARGVRCRIARLASPVSLPSSTLRASRGTPGRVELAQELGHRHGEDLGRVLAAVIVAAVRADDVRWSASWMTWMFSGGAADDAPAAAADDALFARAAAAASASSGSARRSPPAGGRPRSPSSSSRAAARARRPQRREPRRERRRGRQQDPRGLQLCCCISAPPRPMGTASW